MTPATSNAVGAQGWSIVCLCAEWCGLCRDYRSVFQRVGEGFSGAYWRWIDVEDESELAGDVDVETFPTLLVLDTAGQVRFVGALAPHPGVLERLVFQLIASPPAGSQDVPLPEPAVAALAARLRLQAT